MTDGVLPPTPSISLPASYLWRGERRIDGEKYLTGGYGTRLLLDRHFKCRPISDLAEVWMPGRLTGVLVNRDAGVPFLAATQAFDAVPIPRKFLAASRIPHPEAYAVERGWLLVTRSGSVGDCIPTYAPHFGRIISDDLLRVAPKNPDLLGYLYAFLKTRYGLEMLRSSQYGSVVKHLEPDHLREVPVPDLGDEIISRCQDQLGAILAMREEALAKSELAAEVLSEYLPVLATDPATAFDISASDMWRGRRRMDAYHYNRDVAMAHEALSSHHADKLGNLATRVFGVPRFKHVYGPGGTPYLDSEDLFKANPELTKFIPGITDRQRSTYFVERGWLLMACSGQIYGVNGQTVIAGPWHEEKVVSNHVHRIVPAPGMRPGYLQSLLSHPTLGRPLVLALAFGSEVPEIAAEDLKDLPVVRLDSHVEDAIADAAEGAAEIRFEADGAENELVSWLEGKLAVEMAERLKE